MASLADTTMSIKHLLTSFLATAICTTAGTAQLSVIPNTGCSSGSPVGGEIFAVANQQPTVNNPAFALEHVCPSGSTAAFVVWGDCNAGPLLDWDLTPQCFTGWTLPGSCKRVYGARQVLSGNLARQGKVVWAFPIPNIPELVMFTQSNPFCFQFLCVDLNAAPDLCLGFSAGLQMMVMP